jgi:hypothetical protein
VKRARIVTDCLKQANSPTDAAACVSEHVGGDAQKIATCVANPDRAAAGICLLGNTPQAQALQRVSKCIEGGRDASSVIASCTVGILDDKSRQAIACVAKAGDDREQLASCAAGTILPPEAARLVGCATNSQGPTSFALCAAGPSMNEEWRIAAECAVETGGNPVGFVGCTAGQLTIRELTKCFTGEIGKDCYGPNNTIVVWFTDEFSDLTKGPGKNNEIVKALQTVAEVTGGPNSVLNNPGQLTGGHNSLINNPGQITGGGNSVVNNPGQVWDPGQWRF